MIAPFQSLLYDPIYLSLGVPATLTVETGEVFDGLTVIDKTGGIESHDQGPNVPTVLPVACVRMMELAQRGLTVQQCLKGTLEMNGTTWQVRNYKMRPSPQGEAAGEALFVLARKR